MRRAARLAALRVCCLPFALFILFILFVGVLCVHIDIQVVLYPNLPEAMPSNREIAKDWGVAPSYVDRKVKEGCPTDTFEAARMWREAHRQRESRFQKTTVDTEPLTTQNVSNWRQIPEEIGDDFVLGTKEAVRQSWRYLREALIEGKVQKIGAWMALHTRAVEANVRTEAMVREEMERKKVLIPMSDAQAMARKGFEIIIQRLSALPQNIAPRCNPGAPEHAMDILQSEVTGILSDAQRAFGSNGH